MSDYVLIDGDKAIFLPNFGVAMVTQVQPGELKASGPATQGGLKLCVDGDEKSVVVEGCPYFTPSFPLPGTGTLKIKALHDDHRAQKTRTGDTQVLLARDASVQFDAEFTVDPAAKAKLITPTGPQEDSGGPYSGKGYFMPSSNTKFRGV